MILFLLVHTYTYCTPARTSEMTGFLSKLINKYRLLLDIVKGRTSVHVKYLRCQNNNSFFPQAAHFLLTPPQPGTETGGCFFLTP